MNHTPIQGVLQSKRHLSQIIAGLRDRQQLFNRQNLGERLAFDIFHDQQMQVIGVLGVVGRDNVGMDSLRPP